MRRLVTDNGGYYDYWSTGSRASLRELLVNEGLAVHAAQAIAPGFAAAEYFGYPRRQYHRLREMEAFLRRAGGAGAGAERARPAAPLSLWWDEPFRPPGRRARVAGAIRVLSGLPHDRGPGRAARARGVGPGLGARVPGGGGPGPGGAVGVGRHRVASATRVSSPEQRSSRFARDDMAHFPTQNPANTFPSTSSTSTTPTSSSSARVASRTWWDTSTASPPGTRCSAASVQRGGRARERLAVALAPQRRLQIPERDPIAEHPLGRRSPQRRRCPSPVTDETASPSAAPFARSRLVRTTKDARSPASAASSPSSPRPDSTHSSTRSAAER